jgi:hypothetical protein
MKRSNILMKKLKNKMITTDDIYKILHDVDFSLGKSLPVDISTHRINEIKAIKIGELLNKRGYECRFSEDIDVEYIGNLFPRLTYIQCEDFFEYCIKQTIVRKECFGNGKLMLEKWIKEVW